MKMHWEAAAPGVKRVYNTLSVFLEGTSFYLGGGTALALMEAHRVSGDIDLFAPEFKAPEALARRLEGEFGEQIDQVSVAPRTLAFRMSGVPVSLMGYGYPMLKAPGDGDSGLLPLASREDIAAMKLAAIASRGSRKDFIDLWILITRGLPLDHQLKLYRKKYAARDIGHVVRSLVFFDDADDSPPLKLLVDIDWGSVKADFKRWVEALF